MKSWMEVVGRDNLKCSVWCKAFFMEAFSFCYCPGPISLWLHSLICHSMLNAILYNLSSIKALWQHFIFFYFVFKWILWQRWDCENIKKYISQKINIAASSFYYFLLSYSLIFSNDGKGKENASLSSVISTQFVKSEDHKWISTVKIKTAKKVIFTMHWVLIVLLCLISSPISGKS